MKCRMQFFLLAVLVPLTTWSAEKTQVTPAAASPIVWNQRTSGNSFFMPAPLIGEAENVLLQMTGEGLYALELDTGKMLWTKLGKDAGFRLSQPCINKGIVYAAVPTRENKPSREIAAYHSKDGAQIWVHDLAEFFKKESDYGGLHSGIAFDSVNSRILVCAGEEPNERLVALDLNGKQVWAADIGAKLDSPIVSAEQKLAYCCCGNPEGQPSHLAAVNLADGRIAWKQVIWGSSDGAITALPAGERVYLLADDTPDSTKFRKQGAATQGYVICLEAKTGKVIWVCDANEKFVDDGSPARARASCFYHATDRSWGVLTMFSKGVNRRVVGAPMLADNGKRLITQNEYSICGIDTETGKVVWRVRSPRLERCHYALKGDAVLTGDDAGGISAMRASDGQFFWRLDLAKMPASDKVPKSEHGAPVVGPVGDPAVLGDFLYATTCGGYTFKLKMAPLQPAATR
jgi:outer membrane protein assembly factor BamB